MFPWYDRDNSDRISPGILRAQGSHEALVGEINAQAALPEGVFTLLLNKIYKRKK